MSLSDNEKLIIKQLLDTILEQSFDWRRHGDPIVLELNPNPSEMLDIGNAFRKLEKETCRG